MLCRTALRRLRVSNLFSVISKDTAQASSFQICCSRGSQLLTRHQSSSAVYRDLEGWRRSAAEHSASDTIYALSTAPGRAAIAVIRLSGPACLEIYRKLCPRRPLPKPRTATLRKLYDPSDTASPEPRVLDSGALLLYFPAPNTVTGEDVLELHVHGGPAIVRSVLDAIAECGKGGAIRHAEAGEFTKWAFYNGRLDLTQAEALGESLAAETEQQRRLAVSGADGGLAKRYEEWRTMLLYARGELEALIDFSEDQHFDESPMDFITSISKQVVALKRQIKVHLQNASKGELLRSGISIALLGAPNAGKSSLLNRIVGREAAIVSAEEGTTRDIVDVSVDVNGWLCRLGDMAGLRSSDQRRVGLVEQEGIRRARERALQSDVVVVLLSVEADPRSGHLQVPVNDEVLEAVQDCHATGKTILVVLNKMDLVMEQQQQQQQQQINSCSRVEAAKYMHTRVRQMFPMVPDHRICTVSCKAAFTGIDGAENESNDPGGIQAFLALLTKTFMELTTAATGAEGDASDMPTTAMTPAEAQSYWTASLSVTHRQSTYLSWCLHHLDDFLALAQQQQQQAPTDTAAVLHHPHHQSHLHTYHVGTQTQISDSLPASDDLLQRVVDRHCDHLGSVAGPNIATEKQRHTTTTTRTTSTSNDHDYGADDDDGGATVDIVTAAEHLRYAADCLAKITGKGESGDVEDVLGVVFEK